MPDIREVLNALDAKDRVLYSHIRTAMRAEYIKAVNDTVGVRDWTSEDDSFMDLIDIKMAALFDRAGRFNIAKGSIDEEQAAQIEQQIAEAASQIKLEKTPSLAQRALDQFAPKTSSGNGASAEGWKN